MKEKKEKERKEKEKSSLSWGRKQTSRSTNPRQFQVRWIQIDLHWNTLKLNCRFKDRYSGFPILLLTMNILFRSKLHKETLDWNYALDKMYLIHICRTFYPTAAEYTFFSSAHETFSRTDHMLGHKTDLNELEKTEILFSNFFSHKNMKLEFNDMNKTEKFTNMSRFGVVKRLIDLGNSGLWHWQLCDPWQQELCVCACVCVFGGGGVP